MKRLVYPLLGLSLFVPAIAARTEPAPPQSALAKLPVREISAFKDGHAFVLHEGLMPTDASGDVSMDYLPNPVIGTFWPYSADPAVKLTSVVASQRRLSVDRTALNLQELLRANIGAEATISEVNGSHYDATILGLPERSSQELEATGPPNTGEQLPMRGTVILLKTSHGTKVVGIERIQDVTFKDKHRLRVSEEEFRNLLTMKLDWGGKAKAPQAHVGMVYLQKGFRWIPNYKVNLDGAGNANVKLQATLINELTDVKDVTVNLVVGVPTIAFKDTPDTIGLQQAVAQMSRNMRDSQTTYAFSNAIMSQSAYGGGLGPRGTEVRADQPAGDLGPEDAGGGKNEDLFVYTVQHVTLRKGQRMVLPVSETTLKYKDVYTLAVPFAPPPEIRSNGNYQQQTEALRALGSAHVMHAVRITNSGAQPLTTAPALIVRDNRVLAQGMMTYTSVGGETDLPITPAVDVKVTRKERETKRTPNAIQHQGNSLGRVDLEGELCLTNMRGQPIDLEVTRYVLGAIDSADHDGATEMINVFEDDGAAQYPGWWGSFCWSFWWFLFFGLGRLKWKVHLDAGQSVELKYTWHYIAP